MGLFNKPFKHHGTIPIHSKIPATVVDELQKGKGFLTDATLLAMLTFMFTFV